MGQDHISKKLYLDVVNSSILDTWKMGQFVISWITIICNTWVVCWLSAPLYGYKYVKNTVMLGGCWWFLTGVLEDCIISDIKFDIMNQYNLSFLSCIKILSSLAWLKVHQEHSHTWRALMVLDWSFGGLDDLSNLSNLTSWINIIWHSWVACQFLAP